MMSTVQARFGLQQEKIGLRRGATHFSREIPTLDFAIMKKFHKLTGMAQLCPAIPTAKNGTITKPQKLKLAAQKARQARFPTTRLRKLRQDLLEKREVNS